MKIKVISMLVAALALGLMLGTAASALAEDIVLDAPAPAVFAAETTDAAVTCPNGGVCPTGGACDGSGNPSGVCPNPEAGSCGQGQMMRNGAGSGACDGSQQRLRDGSGAGNGACGAGNGSCAAAGQ